MTEDFRNGQGEKIQLTAEGALESLRQSGNIVDPEERERMGEGLSARLNIPGHIDVLRRLFGGYREMAKIAGVSDPRVVKRWSHGIHQPQSLVAKEQLRLALKICAIIYDGENPQVYKGWFSEPNPFLGKKSPIDILTQRDSRGVSKFSGELLRAARDSRRVSA